MLCMNLPRSVRTAGHREDRSDAGATSGGSQTLHPVPPPRPAARLRQDAHEADGSAQHKCER